MRVLAVQRSCTQKQQGRKGQNTSAARQRPVTEPPALPQSSRRLALYSLNSQETKPGVAVRMARIRRTVLVSIGRAAKHEARRGTHLHGSRSAARASADQQHTSHQHRYLPGRPTGAIGQRAGASRQAAKKQLLLAVACGCGAPRSSCR